MVIELFPLQLAFRGLSDEDGDEIEVDSPDIEEDDGDEDDDGYLGGGDDDDDMGGDEGGNDMSLEE